METAVALRRSTAPAHGALLAVVVVWASAFSVIKVLLDHGFAAGDVAFLRYLVAAPGFACLLWRVGWLPGLTRRDAVRLAAVGICVVVGYHISLNVGTKYTTSGTAALVIALAPALTLLLAVGLGLERWSLRRAAGLAVAFAGVAIVVLLGAGGELSFANAKGPLIVLAAPVAFALYNVLLKPLLGRYDLLALTAASSLVGTVFLLPFVSGGTVDSVSGISLEDAALVLYLGVASTFLGYIGWNVGLRGLGATRAVTYTYLISPLAVLFGAVLLDETVTLWLALGGALVVGGVAVAQRARA
ncbi:MAG TPA: DMT family transporter [Gaiellaceae bacterium]|nr:DMT family transporter [Gaiellaceae bacterium]